MSSRITALKEQRAAAYAAANDFAGRAERAEDLTAEDRAAWDRALDDVDRLTGEIEPLERTARLDAVDRASADDPDLRTRPRGGDGAEAEHDEQYARAFYAFMRGGVRGLTPDEARTLQQGYSEVSEARAQGVGTNTAGGYLVPPGFMTKLTETMKAYGGVLQIANIMTTTSGNPLQWPSEDDTTNVGAILGENTQMTQQDLTFGSKSLGAFTYTSKIILVSLQLLQDSAFDLDSHVPAKAGVRIARALAAHLATGTGSGQPEGIATNAIVGKTGANGQTTTVTYDDLIDVQHSVDPAYRQSSNVRWAMNDLSLKAIRKLKDTQGRPLWEPSVQAGMPDVLLGKPITIDNGLPAPAASAKSILFGDFSAGFIVRQVAGGQAMRLTERYADFLQVGFLAFVRLDAKPDDTAAVRAYQNSAT